MDEMEKIDDTAEAKDRAEKLDQLYELRGLLEPYMTERNEDASESDGYLSSGSMSGYRHALMSKLEDERAALLSQQEEEKTFVLKR